MELLLVRTNKEATYTIGDLYVDGVKYCNTLEDVVRDYSKKGFKVYGKTAIPYGRYRVTLEHSPKFSPRYGGRKVPYLHDVPEFSGILIHSGNDETHTDGCILVGRNSQKGKVLNSVDTLMGLLDKMEALPKGEEIWITIKQ